MGKILFWSLFVGSIGYRLWLWNIFGGWEESDYGNIAMIRGVYESGFRQYDMNHMPGYYGIAAFFLFFYNDAVIAGKLAATIGGGLALLGCSLLMRRMVGWYAAVLLMLLLAIQPEFSLYSASSLREPVYTMFVVGMIYCIFNKYWWLAGICSGFSFLVRFEFPLVITPLLFLIVFQYGYQALWRFFLPLVIAIVSWSFYCIHVYETYAFWAHAASSNIETGMGNEMIPLWDWIAQGCSIVGALLFFLLPSRVGWLIWLGWIIAAWVVPKESKVWLLLALSYGLVGVWLLIAFIAQHDANHNLYWKWMYPLIPFVSFCGVWTLWRILVQKSIRIQIVSWSLILCFSFWGYIQESLLQIFRAERMYIPQVRIAEYIEKNASKEKILLVDNIPASWIQRKNNDFRLLSWHDVPESISSPNAFAHFIEQEDIWVVLWFREAWTNAPLRAPFLSNGGMWTHGGITLIERFREDEYGWIFYERIVSSTENDP